MGFRATLRAGGVRTGLNTTGETSTYHECGDTTPRSAGPRGFPYRRTDQSLRGRGSGGLRAGDRRLPAAELFEAKTLLRDTQSFSSEFAKRASDASRKNLAETGGQAVPGCLDQRAPTTVRQQPSIKAAMGLHRCPSICPPTLVDAEQYVDSGRIEVTNIEGAGGGGANDQLVEIAGSLPDPAGSVAFVSSTNSDSGGASSAGACVSPSLRRHRSNVLSANPFAAQNLPRAWPDRSNRSISFRHCAAVRRARRLVPPARFMIPLASVWGERRVNQTVLPIRTTASFVRLRAIAIFLEHMTEEISTLISRIRCAIHHFKELRTALISAAVTGKIDVRDAVP